MKLDPYAPDALRPGLLPCGTAGGGRAEARGPDDLAVFFTDWDGRSPALTRALYGTFPAFRTAFDALCGVLDDCLPIPLVAAVFAPPHGVDAQLLDDARYGRPALLGYQVALFRLWQAHGIAAAVVTGHGVGAFAAAHVAGRLGLGEAARLALRGADCACAADRTDAADRRVAERMLRTEGCGRLLWCGPTQDAVGVVGEARNLLTALGELQMGGPKIDWEGLVPSGTAPGPLEESGVRPVNV
ncbi:acyltransferase domain-containing protein [Streptomyces sp. NPDC006355]|uniref:acyltransferase domain-containing protein n=1 Tax=Streptomyces sp. NPDC006355 TaxID=3156758 RepID=UPI0033B89DD2